MTESASSAAHAPHAPTTDGDRGRWPEEVAAEAALRYLDGLAERPVAPSPEALARLPELGGPLPEHPTPAVDAIRLLDAVASPATVASAGGRYFGFVIGTSLSAARAAS